jgi:hypothetical protein
MKRSHKINENYYLVTIPTNNAVTSIQIDKSTNHIITIDVSGSMSYDLELIRKQLKNKLPDLLTNEKDTITIIWFSGNDQAGILKEEVEVKSLKTLDDLNKAIDRWLQPIGMTAFAKPLILVKEVIQRIKKNRPDSLFSMLFLTDGCNNNIPWSEVIKAAKDLSNDLDNSCIIEYGFYCDSQKLTELCGYLGSDKISCDGFNDYEPVFNKKLSTIYSGGKKINITIPSNSVYDFVFSISTDGSLMLYNIENNSVIVNCNVKEIYYFSNTLIGNNEPLNQSILYAAAYILSDKILFNEAETILAAIGDNHFYKMLSNAYGKQKLNQFKSSIKECITDVSKRFIDGEGKITPIDDNAYSLLNLIDDLGNMDNCLFYPNHPDFNYERIGRERVQVGSTLTDDDQKKLASAKNVAEAQKVMQELADKKIDLEFVDTDPNHGYPLSDLVWNKQRANLSVLVRIEGIAKLPKNKYGIDEVASFKYRTFTLIKDGILNVTKLPVNYSDELFSLLMKNKVKFHMPLGVGAEYLIIDLSSLPIINRGMIKNISANELALQEWHLIKLQANKKVIDYYRKNLFPKESKSFVDMLGQDCADWLKEIGITDYNGYAPKTTAAESTDFYMSVNLETKIKGLSSLPKVEDVIAKMKANKPPKLSEWVMISAIENYALQVEFLANDSLSDDEKIQALGKYTINESNRINKEKRAAIAEIAKIKFSLILSKKWFKEFKSFDENKLSLTIDGQSLDFTFDLSEKEEKI